MPANNGTLTGTKPAPTKTMTSALRKLRELESEQNAPSTVERKEEKVKGKGKSKSRFHEDIKAAEQPGPASASGQAATENQGADSTSPARAGDQESSGKVGDPSTPLDPVEERRKVKLARRKEKVGKWNEVAAERAKKREEKEEEVKRGREEMRGAREEEWDEGELDGEFVDLRRT